MARPGFDADALLREALRGERACGDLRLRIDRSGEWSYQGSRIDRPALVRLFASVLRRAEDGGHWLVTPGEVGRIEVEDAPFVAVEMRAEGEGTGRLLSFRTNLDEWVPLDDAHPLRLAPGEGGAEVPYLTVRDRLEARLGRPVYYELVGLAEPGEGGGAAAALGVWSGGRFWRLGEGDG
jgi:hypothetical protein